MTLNYIPPFSSIFQNPKIHPFFPKHFFQNFILHHIYILDTFFSINTIWLPLQSCTGSTILRIYIYIYGAAHPFPPHPHLKSFLLSVFRASFHQMTICWKHGTPCFWAKQRGGFRAETDEPTRNQWQSKSNTQPWLNLPTPSSPPPALCGTLSKNSVDCHVKFYRMVHLYCPVFFHFIGSDLEDALSVPSSSDWWPRHDLRPWWW